MTLRLGTPRLLGDTVAFAQVQAIEPFESVLVVLDRMQDPHVKAINRQSGRVVQEFGRQGGGPREFEVPVTILRVDDRPPLFDVFDFRNRRLTRIRLSAEAYDVDSLRTTPLSFEGHIRKLVRLEGGYLGSGMFHDYTLIRLDDDGRQVRRLVADPPFAHVGHSYQSVLNTAFIARRPGRPHLALGYTHENRIDIVDWSTGSYSTVSGPYETEARYHLEDGRFFFDEGSTQAYVGLDASDEYIYAVFCGCPYPWDSNVTTTVHVFTWEGEFVAELDLGQGPLTALRVSADDGFLWGGIVTPYPRVAEWRIPELGTAQHEDVGQVPANSDGGSTLREARGPR